ncbi:SCO4402 family protein [Micromonospora tulbaghiae]
MSEVRFPDLRNEMVRAVKALADPAHQWSAWVRRELPPGGYDEFTHRIHILYDDTQVLEDPDAAIGIYLRSQEEADALRGLVPGARFALPRVWHRAS